MRKPFRRTLTACSCLLLLAALAGWLRSQCPASGNPGNLNCPAGPGPDNDYATVNQFLQYPLSGTQSASNIDTGLLPDWPGDGLLPPAPPIPANSVDMVARLS